MISATYICTALALVITLMPLLGLPEPPFGFGSGSLLLACASFILAIVCMAKKKIAHGFINLIAIVIGMPLIWLLYVLVGLGVMDVIASYLRSFF